jgi:hypothetical protein
MPNAAYRPFPGVPVYVRYWASLRSSCTSRLSHLEIDPLSSHPTAHLNLTLLPAGLADGSRTRLLQTLVTRRHITSSATCRDYQTSARQSVIKGLMMPAALIAPRGTYVPPRQMGSFSPAFLRFSIS